jgi:carboxylate-amine ligase
VRENKWLASRHGLDSSFIVDASGRRRPAAALLTSLIDDLGPTASGLRCDQELQAVHELVSRGPSYRRQRRIVAEGGDLVDVVAALVHEHREGPR